MTVVEMVDDLGEESTEPVRQERCSICDRPLYESDGDRHTCFYFLE